MGLNLPSFIRRCLDSLCHDVKQRLRRWTKPDHQGFALNVVLDLTRSKSELVLENALVRQQVIVLQRPVKRPTLTRRDRALFVLIASKLPSWRMALMIVQPDTLLRWHRELFRQVWRRKSRRKGKKGRESLADDIVTLIKNLAQENRTWGAERIRGEQIKLVTTAAGQEFRSCPALLFQAPRTLLLLGGYLFLRPLQRSHRRYDIRATF